MSDGFVAKSRILAAVGISAAIALSVALVAPAEWGLGRATEPTERTTGTPSLLFPRPEASYYLYVAAESDDTVSLVRFGPEGLEELERIRVGRLPAEIEGPHGLNVSPDGEHWYLSLAHGQPFGSLHKFTTADNELTGSVELGMFPATLDVSAATGLAYVVNFDLHGGLEPSTVSVVEVETMSEVARIDTGIMPHGSRLDADGSRQYHVAMMNDELVEVDAFELAVRRVLPLSENAPSARMGDPRHGGAATGPGEADEHWSPQLPPIVKPTWVSPPMPSGHVYIAGNGNDTIVEVDLHTWTVSRTWHTSEDGSPTPEPAATSPDSGSVAAGTPDRSSDSEASSSDPGTSAAEPAADGPYNLALTPDGGLLVVTYKSGDVVAMWDIRQGVELARIPTTRSVPHGVAVSPDGRYAFVSVEGVGGDPGTVEAYDLESLERVASVDVGPQAGGIAFWKIEP